MLPFGGELGLEVIQQDDGGLAGDFADQLGLGKSHMQAAREGTEEIVMHDAVGGVYKRIVIKDERIVGSVLYLVSDASSYTSGSTLVVDGGMNT